MPVFVMTPQGKIMRNLILIFGLLGLAACTTTANNQTERNTAQQQTPAAEFHQLADTIWEGLNQSSDTELTDMSPEALEKRYQQRSEWLQQLNAINLDALSRDDQINHAMIHYTLKNKVDEYRFNAHYMPLTAEGSFHSSLAFMPSYTSFSSAEDYQNYIAKLRSIPRYMEQQTHWLHKAIEEGYTQPAAAMAGFEESILAYIVQDAENSVYFSPFSQQPGFIDDEQWQQLKEDALTAIDDQVMPAYDDYFTFMVTEYLPGARDTIGASELPSGEDFYQNRIKHYTTLDMTADEIHQVGLQEVARIRGEMLEAIEATGFDGSFDEFVEFLRTDDQFYPETAEELLQYEQTYISAFGEGWGLYSEYLGLEAGFYKDPYSNFGRLSYEMWRAARLVVDTGMHAKGWSRERAMEFMANNTALSLHNVKTEIDRYITWPAQALSYKLGELTIKRLRAEAEQQLGDKFDIREFHDAVLENGSVPLKVLEQHINDWIAEQK
ncbi:MAG: DUF885 domain-containing protein [Idiomarina sp.]|nr:DUF885 domain-containing protein [Idiomarina sp.]